MRVAFDGDPGLVTQVGELVVSGLQASEYATVVQRFPNITIELLTASGPDPEMDSVDTEFERQIARHLGELCVSHRVVLDPTGKCDERRIRITVPPSDVEAAARAISRSAHDLAARQQKKRWYQFLGLALLLASTSALAQAPPPAPTKLEEALTSLARLHVQLVEKDRQIASLQFDYGKKLLDADAAVAQCQLQQRADQAVDYLRQRESPPAGSVFDMRSGQWTAPKKDQEKK